MAIPHFEWVTTRRDFLTRAGLGFGGLALGSLLAEDGLLPAASAEMPEINPLEPLAPRPPHFRGRARSCIFLFMEGGPSHVDLFDPKPELTRNDGKSLPPSFGTVFTP